MVYKKEPKEGKMKRKVFCLFSMLITILISSCAAPRQSSHPQGSGDQPQQGANPPRGGYEEQMRQEKDAQRRQAAGELLPGLMELQNQMIRQQNQK